MTKPAHVESDAVAIKTAILKYERRKAAGQGRLDPVVMLHPWFGCVRFWDRTVEALPEYDTLALDFYSLGARPGWEEFATPQGLSRAVEAFADALRLERIIVIGNSMGGIAAQDLASRLNGRISKLILVGTGARIFGVKPEWRKAMDAWMSGDPDRSFTEQMVAALLKLRPSDPREFETFVDDVAAANKTFMGTVLASAFEFDLRPALPRITAPTLVIRGEFDASRTPQHVAELMSGIPNCRAREISGAGHSPQVDSHEAFCALVREFLES
jgi:pimeloyl-ACP methyl ester carboxylesterase